MLRTLLRVNPVARAFKSFLEDFSRFRQSPFKSMIRMFSSLNNPTIIDVGANVGQFGMDMRRSGFKGQIISFEPISALHFALTKNSFRYQPWKAFNLALGLEPEVKEINVSGNSGLSSSFLEMHVTHANSFPESQYVSRELVDVTTLDLEIDRLQLDPKNIILKLDVQGFESQVLRGAAKSLSLIPYCFIEVSIKTLYEGEMTLLPLLNLLKASGHEVIDIYRGIQNKAGELLQVDILTSSQ